MEDAMKLSLLFQYAQTFLKTYPLIWMLLSVVLLMCTVPFSNHLKYGNSQWLSFTYNNYSQFSNRLHVLLQTLDCALFLLFSVFHIYENFIFNANKTFHVTQS